MTMNQIHISVNGNPAELPKPVIFPNAKVGEASVPAAANTLKAVEPNELPKLASESSQIKFDPKELQQQLTDIVESLNKQMKSNNRNLGFAFDANLGVHVITVSNTETGEVIRQIPSETVMRVAHKFEELKGLFHDKTI